LLADATEHGVLLEALVAGDVGTVEALAREHFAGAAWG
jgi:DNA-binding GntR family transcriptional regulator